MPDRPLFDDYLERLDQSLPLPDDTRASAVEEIAAHVTMAADALVAGGMSREAAERRALERIGAPDRLADDIAAAHRTPSNLLAAAGMALRVSLVTTLQAFILAWAGVFVLALALGLGVAGVRRLIGSGFLQTDWSPLLDGFLPAVVGGLVSYAVGRAIVLPVAAAARRRPPDVRMPLLLVGVAVAIVISLTAIEARWTLATAAAMATMPAWFALGVLRPALIPTWHAPRWTLPLVGVLVVVSTSLLVLGITGWNSGGSIHSDAYDPSEEYASVGPFVDIDNPPLKLDVDTSSAGPWQGDGPVLVERSGTFTPGVVEGWADVRLEVWPGPPGEMVGPALDRTATKPLATAPMEVDAERASGVLQFAPMPDRHSYYVTVTGLDSTGERWQLSWPDITMWRWHGTPLELVFATWP